ncbi:vWA domain-containing protein [Sediminicola luteus]|uniref:VWFA domain-containing protein n=1 Tax=Sediminicola luteus TaxID=319238 RepID=A0A2A4G698_9FLAO|nr:vWA domain-containing protein [Sediminicola luteus]PCE63262.1 hypothetical protein B7P33_13630 [Sediminicola luteus]
MKKSLLILAFSCFGILGIQANDKKSDKCSTPESHENLDKKQTVKIALLLDTSNSMDGLINQAKTQLWDIVNSFSYAKCGNGNRPDLEIALYQYGNDRLSAREGYIQQVMPFSNDLDEISEKLFALRTDGGEEYCGTVIDRSLKQLDWGKNRNDLKMIFIAGNEPFSQGKLDYKDAVLQAKEKDVVVNTIFCGDFQQGVFTHWKDGATLSGGEYMAIDHNKEVVHIPTPYDDQIIILNKKLNKTYISYGSLGAAKAKQQALQDTNAMEMEAAVAVKRSVSKSSRLYKNSTWDLVDASDDANFNIAEVKKSDLPKNLQDKSTAELNRYIAQQKAERQKIQKEIQALNAKRDTYLIRNQKEGAKGELENALLKAIKTKAAEKDYHWE